MSRLRLLLIILIIIALVAIALFIIKNNADGIAATNAIQDALNRLP